MNLREVKSLINSHLAMTEAAEAHRKLIGRKFREILEVASKALDNASNRQMATMLGVTVQQISQMKTGMRLPTVDFLTRLLTLLKRTKS